ncbi:MAG: glutamate formimidoyltransferase, partial [Actinobacteria bacterium]|nr:glutamate formimidoyltransferase [Actinomycetota bacterium]
IHSAILSLGLDDLYTFKPEEKIIEFRIEKHTELVEKNVNEFTDVLSTDAPAPGGGSVAALCGALSGALSSMVAALTFGKKGHEDSSELMQQIGVNAQKLKDEFLADVDRDTAAFNKVMDTWRLPKKTDKEKQARTAIIEEATKEATLVPFDVLKRTEKAAELARKVVEKGNTNSISDAGVAAMTARTAAEGAYLNVRINLPGISDKHFRSTVLQEAKEIRKRVVEHTEETVRLTEKALEESA